MKKLALILLFLGFYPLLGQENILEKNQSLLKKLVLFERIHNIDNQYIKFSKEIIKENPNNGFGVAWRKTGEIIYPEDKDINNYMQVFGQYIVLLKEPSSKFGMIDNQGNIVLDFKYDRIGTTALFFPEYLIPVQLGKKFGFFDTRIKQLSEIKYDNSGGWLNDKYAAVEGEMHRLIEKIYSQLDSVHRWKERDIPIIKPQKELEISPEKYIKGEGGNQYLVDEKGKKISKNYSYIYWLSGHYKPAFYMGAIHYKDSYRNPPEFFLIDENGTEIAPMKYSLGGTSPYYFCLENKQYYFIETQKIVKIPNEYELLTSSYEAEGFLIFRKWSWEKPTPKEPFSHKIIVDKFGNFLTSSELIR